MLYENEAQNKPPVMVVGSVASSHLSPFPTLLEMVLKPLILALRDNGNDLDKITDEDILSRSTMLPDTYAYYYGHPYTIITEVHKDISEVISEVSNDFSDDVNNSSSNNTGSIESSAESALYDLLNRLRAYPDHLLILVLTNDLTIWLKNLSWLFNWYCTSCDNIKSKTPTEQETLYRHFCFEFNLLIDRWAVNRFSPDFLPILVDRILEWLYDFYTVF